MSVGKIAIVLAAVLLAGMAAAQNLFDEQAVFNTEAQADRYNIELSLRFSPSTPPDHGVQAALEWDAPSTGLLVTVLRSAVVLAVMKDGRAAESKRFAITPMPDVALRLTLLRRQGWLGLLVDEKLLGGIDLPRGPGGKASLHAGQGWTAEEPVLQVLEPVNFADDFMRVDNPFWKTERGQWQLQSAWSNDAKTASMGLVAPGSAQNPFALVGKSAGDGAWCTATAGKPFWEDYTCTVAMQPPQDGAVGVLVNMTAPDAGLLVRWSPAGDHGPQGNRLSLCRFAGGKLTVLAESPGGFIPGQWFKISVTSHLQEGVQVAIDDRIRLPFSATPVRRGGIGLYSESLTGALFDDITVLGQGIDTDLLAETRLAHLNQRFQDDKEMKLWARTQSDWTTWPAVGGQWRHRFEFYGDHRLVATVAPTAAPTGTLALILNSDGIAVDSGYRAVIQRAENGAVTYTLYRNTDILVAVKPGEPCRAGEEYAFRFLREGNRLCLQRDGEAILEAVDPQPLAGTWPGYRAEGCFSTAHDVLALGRRELDYPFTTAPTDWLGEGAWMPSIRWSCAPQWSFLAGWSRGDAVLWHKQRFSGDQTFQAVVGIKMEYPRQRRIYEERFRGLGITICGDGHNPRSGYTVIFGAPDDFGSPNRLTVLLRNGVVVGTIPDRMPDKTYAHHTWFDMVLQKHGATIDFQVKYISKNMWWGGDPGHEVIVKMRYTDPEPLTGGVPAVWTTDNGITIARARLLFADPPQPRTEPLLAISDPWYPEWLDCGKTLTLDYPVVWSTSGNTPELHVEPSEVPSSKEAEATVKGNQLTFSPRHTGSYWYKIFATDGPQRSPATHLYLPVFDPALGRDDSHALVLYRFNEGDGTLVHDHGSGPAADLVIPDGCKAAWLPGKGLAFTGPAPLMTKQGVPKLMALKEHNAFTLEFWVSAATIDPPTASYGCLLSWGGTGGEARNFTLYHFWYYLTCIGPDAHYIQEQQRWTGSYWQGVGTINHFVPHLQHVVLCWDGKQGHLYVDGNEIPSRGDFHALTAQWTADAPLLLGNLGDLRQNFIGTYYLAAIHDCCLSAEEVRRHYRAGPGAK